MRERDVLTARRVVRAAGLILGVLTLVGCDRESDAAKAVRSGATELVATTGGGAAPASPSVRDATFKSVSSKVTTPATESSGSEQAAALLLLSESQFGQAAAPAQAIVEAERKARSAMATIGTLLDLWSTHSAVADVAESFDPSARLSEIAKAKEALDAQAAQAGVEQQQIEARVNALRTQAGEKLQAAASRQGEYEAIMARALRVSATQAAELVREANAIRRQGDALRLAGETINADADAIAPLIEEAQLRVAQLRNQKADLERQEAELRQRREAAQQRASEARTAATVAANQLDEYVTALNNYRDEAKDAYSRAVELYGKSASTAQRANSDSPSMARMAQGGAQHALAQLHVQRAQDLKVYATLLETIGNANPKAPAVQPPLPYASKYAQAGKAARDEAAEMLAAAAAAYDNAKTAFESVRAQGETKDRLTALGAALERAKEKAEGKGLDEAAAARVGDAALAETINNILVASREKRNADVIGYMHLPTPEVKNLMEAVVRLDEACLSKLGKRFQEIAASGMPMGSMGGGFDAGALGNLTLDAMNVTITGGSATATAEGLPTPLEFVKVDGAWKLKIPGGEMMAMAGPMLGPIGGVMDELAAAVSDGSITTGEDLMQRFQTRLQEVMMNSMQGEK
ncbi:MAG: hypothetical protein IPM33_09320 [Phycisphaerales bacterium]|nr:hypothetical protein [Phycisphaerales bacterium]